MKAFYFKDGIQIVLAIVLTGSMAFAMQPTAVEEPQSASKVETVQTIENEPETAPEPVKTAVEEPKTTWRDNPNKCDEETQWIAKEEPFKCIDKPAPTESAAPDAAQYASDGTSCDDWIASAGIKDIANAKELIRRESGCDPRAVNPSSGACGVAQELPCGKSRCGWDGACQVRWMNSYVLGRYGSWANAVAFHNANNWY